MAVVNINLAVELAEINCGQCGGVYAITEKYRQHRYDHGLSWNCPYCQTGWGYSGRGALQLKEKELAAERERHQATLTRLNQTQAALSTKEKQLGRVKAGTCPCCKRTFKQLAAHMKNKHPEVK